MKLEPEDSLLLSHVYQMEKPYWLLKYNSKEEVIEVIICGCFVPFYFGFVPPTFRGVRYVDGGITNFHPFFDGKSMITISPFTGEIDICPRDCPVGHLCVNIFNTSFLYSIQNMCRVVQTLFPPTTTVLKSFYFQGYKDAFLYLISIGKIDQSTPCIYNHIKDSRSVHVLKEDQNDNWKMVY
ncbi:omega-hydroxyceramide transacylase-like [Bufo bufo]|uniref:omega-hydroxyceramide transacylase-like n=1 Tax=Bufo bufo TaxID=8384 RepID=UPI001ABE37A7|nr:omega-hydroxyceramide transacylase-like [Bufo bufo]